MLSPDMVRDWHKDAEICSAGRIETRLMKACDEILRLQQSNKFLFIRAIHYRMRISNLIEKLRSSKEAKNVIA